MEMLKFGIKWFKIKNSLALATRFQLDIMNVEQDLVMRGDDPSFGPEIVDICLKITNLVYVDIAGV